MSNERKELADRLNERKELADRLNERKELADKYKPTTSCEHHSVDIEPLVSPAHPPLDQLGKMFSLIMIVVLIGMPIFDIYTVVKVGNGDSVSELLKVLLYLTQSGVLLAATTLLTTGQICWSNESYPIRCLTAIMIVSSRYFAYSIADFMFSGIDYHFEFMSLVSFYNGASRLMIPALIITTAAAVFAPIVIHIQQIITRGDFGKCE